MFSCSGFSPVSQLHLRRSPPWQCRVPTSIPLYLLVIRTYMSLWHSLAGLASQFDASPHVFFRQQVPCHVFCVIIIFPSSSWLNHLCIIYGSMKRVVFEDLLSQSSTGHFGAPLASLRLLSHGGGSPLGAAAQCGRRGLCTAGAHGNGLRRRRTSTDGFRSTEGEHAAEG